MANGLNLIKNAQRECNRSLEVGLTVQSDGENKGKKKKRGQERHQTDKFKLTWVSWKKRVH